jgi:hypothetical protein
MWVKKLGRRQQVSKENAFTKHSGVTVHPISSALLCLAQPVLILILAVPKFDRLTASITPARLIS